ASPRWNFSTLTKHEQTSRPHPQWQRRSRQKLFRCHLRPAPQRPADRPHRSRLRQRKLDLKRFHPDAEFLDLANPRALDAMFRSLEKTDLVVVDCRAASSDLFFDYFAEINLRATLNALAAAL